MARRSPIDWAMRTVIPPPGMTPSRAWVSANFALSDATRKVHCSAISSPPVTATPLTAPMIGLSMRGRNRYRPLAPRSGPSPGPRGAALGGDSPVTSLRSTPAQKAGSAPVRITTATPGSSPAAATASHRAKDHGPAQRVPRPGPVQRDRGDAVLHVDEDEGFGVGHGVATPMQNRVMCSVSARDGRVRAQR